MRTFKSFLCFFFQYLRLRFNQKVRLLGSIIFIIKMMLYIPIVIYVPALAFSQGIIFLSVLTCLLPRNYDNSRISFLYSDGY